MRELKIEEFLAQDNSKPVFVVVNAQTWDASDALIIAKEVVNQIANFLLVLIPEVEGAGYTEYQFKDFICTTRIVADAAPAVRVLAREAEISVHRYENCKVLIEKIYAYTRPDRNFLEKEVIINSVVAIFNFIVSEIKRADREAAGKRKKKQENFIFAELAEKRRIQKQLEFREQKRIELEELRQQIEALERKLRQRWMARPVVPITLQPQLPAFDESNMSTWFEIAKTTYDRYEYEAENLPYYIQTSLPAYMRAAH